MMQTAQALTEYFNGFGIPAYAENTVPDEAELPYITYPLTEPAWDSKTPFHVIVYYRNQTSNLDSISTADAIVRAIADGVRLRVADGWIVLWPETPIVQSMPPEGDVRAAYINLSLNAYKTFGA